ncbi:hypothetical protein BB561_006849, partial [Smittium simulii]
VPNPSQIAAMELHMCLEIRIFIASSNKLVQDETDRMSHLVILINKLINKVWNNFKLIGTNNTSVVVPIFKNGNRQDPNNYRDMSLIHTLTKLTSKLTSNIICKEQAGLKTKEKCVAQATTLYEIIKRRNL